ncbi:MAG: hypothetical protein IJ735_07735 [Clostridia bacterium]|nr:hypothetical protein [Clostridia bacterium]
MFDTLAFAKGAVFDYEEIVAMTEIDKGRIRKIVLPTLREENGARIKRRYSDKKSGKNLLLFIDRGYDFGPMRVWVVRGICEESDYDEEMEKDGLIDEWLEVEIE